MWKYHSPPTFAQRVQTPPVTLARLPVLSSRTFLTGRLGGRPRLLAGHKNSVSSDVSEVDHKHKGKERERSPPAAPRKGAPKPLPRAGPSPHSWPLREGTGNSTAASSPAPGPRPFRGVPAASSASLSTPPLGCLRERGRGRPVSSKSRLLGRAGPRLPEPSGQLNLSQQLGHALSPVLGPYQSSAAPATRSSSSAAATDPASRRPELPPGGLRLPQRRRATAFSAGPAGR